MRAGLVCALAALLAGACAAEGPWYVGGGAGLLLPGGGSSCARAAETSLRAGRYAGDFLAWEAEGVCAPNVSCAGGREALSGAAVRGLFHFAGLEAFDRLFGCERFDPFATLGAGVRFGARHAFADGARRTAAGPVAGLGAFYHLTESLDLRFDAQALLVCDAPCGMLYSLGLSLQWNFGGGGT